ncbi:MAG: hypothetical protein JST62_01810 [Bacteroidetes bacterium]|nr:hypothetical protein [Bacteroidota bacterium]
MKYLSLILSFLSVVISAQTVMKIDSISLKGVSDFLADDYGNIYLYKNKDFSWTKYDSIGNQQGRLMLTQPYTLQDVQNPLNIPLFSQNAQTLKFIDANFNEIQQISLNQKFGNIATAFVEDLQTVWLLEESTNRLLQYYYRDGKIINSYPIFFSFFNIKNMIIYDKKIYLLREKSFEIYNFEGQQIEKSTIIDGNKIVRENDKIYIICKNEILEHSPSSETKIIFIDKKAKILTKNNNRIFVIKENKIYLYPNK